MVKQKYNIPAGWPYSFGVKMSRAEAGSGDYTDITDAAAVPSGGWTLCFVDTLNRPALSIPLDWDNMTQDGLLFITLTAEQTLAVAGKRLRMEVRNNDTVTCLTDDPSPIFYFVPNDLHNYN